MVEAACVEAKRWGGSWLSLRELVEVPSSEAGPGPGHSWLRARSRIVTWSMRTLTGDWGSQAATSGDEGNAVRPGSLTSDLRIYHWRLDERGVRGRDVTGDGRRGRDLVSSPASHSRNSVRP